MTRTTGPSRPGRRFLAIALIAGGVLGILYGGFTFTSGYHRLDLGVTELRWRDRDTLYVPVWVGVVAVAAGAVMLFNRKNP